MRSQALGEFDVNYKIGKYTALLPSSHPLPSYQEAHPKYDRYFSKWLELIGKKPLILDIGANVGDTVLFLCSYSKCKVFAIEPAQEFFEYLELNVKRNRLDHRVTLERLALLPGKEKKSVSLMTGKGTASTKIHGTGKKLNQKFQVMTVSDYLKNNEESFDLIKMDTDGLDVYLVRDVIENEKASRSILLFELDHSFYGKIWKAKFTELFKRLETLKYSLIVVDNLGRPMMALNHDLTLLNHLFVWIENQRKLHFRSAYYLDIWAFPVEQTDAYNKIVSYENFNDK
jgi:FkbM family methyltransferase